MRGSDVQKFLIRDSVFLCPYPVQPKLVEWDVIGCFALRAAQKDEETEPQKGAPEAALKTPPRLGLNIRFHNCEENWREATDLKQDLITFAFKVL